jgi:hypothetical protein
VTREPACRRTAAQAPHRAGDDGRDRESVGPAGFRLAYLLTGDRALTEDLVIEGVDRPIYQIGCVCCARTARCCA